MGQTLSSPATNKTSESDADERYIFAISEMQGWRISMEDAHAAVLTLEDGTPASGNSFFAVYDGHGGGTVAKYAGQHVHQRLVSEEAYQQKDYEQALKRAFLGTDEDLLKDPAHARDPSGCTAVAALIADGKVYVANAGDSRIVISVKGEVTPLSFDHKPTNESERTRIVGAGGYVEYGRVNGNLALSRAIGDFEFKKNAALGPEKQAITCDPDIIIHERTDEDEFIVLACDGIWDCLTNQQAVDFVRREVANGKELQQIGEEMMDHCLAPDTTSGAGIGCDNMTVMIVALLNGRTKEQWYQWIKERYESSYGFATPDAPPQLYAASRISAFKARLEASRQSKDRSNDYDDSPAASFLNAAGLGGFARVLGSTGGISFQPGGSIMSDSGNLMFGPEDSDEDDDSDEGIDGSTFFSEALGMGGNNSNASSADAASILKARIEAYEKDLQNDTDSDDEFGVETAASSSGLLQLADDTQTTVSTSNSGETAPASTHTPLSNGNTVQPVEQLKSTPGGDKPSPAVKAEGLMDTSEDPTVNN